MSKCGTCSKELRVDTDGVVTVRVPCCKERKALCSKNKRNDPCGAIVQVYAAPYDHAQALAWFCSKHANQDFRDEAPPPPDEPTPIELLDDSEQTVSGMKHEARVLTGTKRQVTFELGRDKSKGACTSCGLIHAQKNRKLVPTNPGDEKVKTGRTHWTVVCPSCGATGFHYV